MYSPLRTLLLGLGLGALTGCGTPMPNDLVLFDLPGADRYALSTEDGIVSLQNDDLKVGALPMKYWFKATPVLFSAEYVQGTEDLALLKTRDTQLLWSEFAADGPRPGEDLYVQILEGDPEHRPAMVEVALYADGEFGDLLEMEDWFRTCSGLAGEFGGAGVYAKRSGRYVLVGVLSGTVATNPNPSILARVFGPWRLMPYVGLDTIAAVLPTNSNFFERRIRPFRPDFEYGLRPDGEEPESVNR